MKNSPTRHAVYLSFFLVTMAVVAPAEAQRDYEPLLDKFNIKLEASWIGMTTQIRLDSEMLGEGTTLTFEDDLDLGLRLLARDVFLGVGRRTVCRDLDPAVRRPEPEAGASSTQC